MRGAYPRPNGQSWQEFSRRRTYSPVSKKLQHLCQSSIEPVYSLWLQLFQVVPGFDRPFVCKEVFSRNLEIRLLENTGNSLLILVQTCMRNDLPKKCRKSRHHLLIPEKKHAGLPHKPGMELLKILPILASLAEDPLVYIGSKCLSAGFQISTVIQGVRVSN
mgnify:CR=1 FL=1